MHTSIPAPVKVLFCFLGHGGDDLLGVCSGGLAGAMLSLVSGQELPPRLRKPC